MRIFFFFALSIIFAKSIFSQDTECQGAVLRILNKTTNEKIFYTVPLSQTIELDNASVVVHRCIKVEYEGIKDDIALLMHRVDLNEGKDNIFFGWIFNSSQYINSPNNPLYDIKLQECLIEDPIFLKNKGSI